MYVDVSRTRALMIAVLKIGQFSYGYGCCKKSVSSANVKNFEMKTRIPKDTSKKKKKK